MVVEKKRVSIQEFEAFTALPENRDRHFELIHGEIVEKMPTELHGLIAGRIIGEIYIYLKQHPGRVAPEVRHQMPGDPHNARMHDISYVADVARPVVDRGAVSQMPDLAVEIKSPDDTYREMREKADYYLANGARTVWLIYPEKRLVEVHTTADFLPLTEADTLDGGEVLPGLSLPVRDIFPA